MLNVRTTTGGRIGVGQRPRQTGDGWGCLAAPTASGRFFVALLVTLTLNLAVGRGLSAADPVVPSTPSTPGVPSVPSAPSTPSGTIPESSTLPSFGPGEGLPNGTSEMPQMELIPPGQTPLQPVQILPNLNLGTSGPLVALPAQSTDPKALTYKVAKFTVKYGPPKNPPHPGLPPAQKLADSSITLGESAKPEDGYVAPGAGARDVPVVLSKFNTADTFHGDALQAISLALSAEVNKAGIYGVFVIPDPDQINASTGEDLRKGGTELTMLVYASEVKQVRTIVKPVPKPPFKGVATTADDAKYKKITTNSR